MGKGWLLRALTAVILAACVALPASAGAVDPPVRATMFKSTQQSVRVVFRNDGAEPVVAVRQVLPYPFVVTEATPSQGSCSLGGRGEYLCTGFVAPPGGTWEVAFDSPPTYNDQTGLDASYYPQDGPAAFYVATASGAELGPFDALWDARGSAQDATEVAAVALKTTPKRPRLGGRLDVQLRLATSDLRVLRTRGRVRCGARLPGRALRTLGSGISARAVARCSWRLPRASAARLVRGEVEVRLGRAIVRRVFAVRVAAA